MKILMLTPYLPYPPASGGQIRTLNLLKYLHEKHEVTLISLYKSNREKQYASYLNSYCSKVYVCKRAEKPWQFGIISNAIFTPKPLLIVRNFSAEARILMENLLRKEKFDVIHAETFYIMPHIPKTKIPILLVEQTIEYKVYQHFVNNLPALARPFFNIDIFKLQHWEKYYWNKATLVATVSEIDKNIIRHDEPFIHPVIIPNGAGDEMFVDTLSLKHTDPPSFLFQGNFSWLQNREAANLLVKHIFPLIKQSIPKASLIIAGQETQKVDTLQIEGIRLVEIKPDDSTAVKNIYKEASIFIAPIHGPGGTRLKLLAAMASGLPIISTKTGVEGLDVTDGKHVLIANNPHEFVQSVQKILNNKSLYTNIRKNAFDLVKKKYSWRSISAQLERVYKTIIQT